MAKRRRTVTRSHAPSQDSYRPGFSRGPGSSVGRGTMAPPSSRRNNNSLLWIVAGVAAVVVVGGLLYLYGTSGSSTASPTAPIAEISPTTTQDAALIHPPAATPLASPPASPEGDGTTATIQTSLGNIVFQIYNESAPVASENFENLANAGFYNGLDFWRVVPSFVIQGGDPTGDGTGGPGYQIQDDPVVGSYKRGTVAMANTGQPNSAGSQFFIVLDDSVDQQLGRTYSIFGNVTSGMDVVDQIAAGPAASSEAALDPTVMSLVTIQPPTPGASSSTGASAAPSPLSAPSAPASPVVTPTPNPSDV